MRKYHQRRLFLVGFVLVLALPLGVGCKVVVAGTIASDVGTDLEELAAGFVDRSSITGCGRGGIPDPGTGVVVRVG